MLEETATVRQVAQGVAWVETEPRSACGHCSTRGACGSGALTELLGRRRPLVPVSDTLGVTVGERVVIGIADQMLLRAALRAYLLPLLLAVVPAGLATAAGAGDGIAALLAIAGLLGGLYWSGFITARGGARERYRPRLLRRWLPPGAAGMNIELINCKPTGASS